jgi:hypothetical protein
MGRRLGISIYDKLLPLCTANNDLLQWWLKRVRKIRASLEPDDIKDTIFEGILASNLPENEKTDARMAHDVQLIALAGESTTGENVAASHGPERKREQQANEKTLVRLYLEHHHI